MSTEIHPSTPRRDLTGGVAWAALGCLIAALSWQRHRRDLAEKSLRESEERFRGVLESSRDAAYRYNLQTGVFDYLSPVAGLILGCDLHEAPVVAGSTDAERIHPEDLERVRAVAASTLRNGSAVYQVEYRFRCKNGEYRWIDDYGSVMRDAQGQPRFLTGALREITERKRSEEEKVHLEAQLRQSQKMESIGRLAGGVAQDFNKLLTVINGYGEIVASQLREDDPARAQVEMIRQAGEHASRLTQQLLAFSRKQIIRPEPLMLNAAIANSEGMLRRLMGEDIRLRTLLDPDLGLVLADGGQLDQVLMNLAANARDAMPTGGELAIQTANVELDESFAATHPEVVPGPAVLLTVTDTGTGMSEEVQRHVFEPFYTTKEKGRGTGLGLATVYRIVQQSRGVISVHSEPDKGSTFKIYFPRLPEGEAEKAPSLVSTPDSHGTETILVVEDQDNVRTLAVTALKSSGYVVLEAANGQQALRLAESCAGPIHAMVTDVVMPGMSGPELASRMKEVRPETRVIFTSGYTDDAVVTRGVLTRGVEYLPKPYSLGVLLATVRRVLGPKS